MDKLIKWFKKNMKQVSVVVLVCAILTGVIYVISSTYAASSYTIVFNRAEDTEVMKTCKTNANGKLEDECISVISKVCSKWSLNDIYDSAGQTDPINSADFANKVFTKDTDYYCVGGTSLEYNMGCYVCNDNEDIMHYAANGNSDSRCPSGYYKSTTITTEEDCVVESCYVCKNDSNIMKWGTSGISDDECTSGYDPIDKPKNECKTIIPESCYVCKNDSNIMKWGTNGNSDSNCSSGYDPIDKPKNECKTIIPESCYVCNNNSNIMKWGTNGNSDSNCSSGYTAKDVPVDECKPIDNPPTGNVFIFIVWAIGLGAICYSIYYFKSLKKS